MSVAITNDLAVYCLSQMAMQSYPSFSGHSIVGYRYAPPNLRNQMPFTELKNDLNERASLGLLRQRRMLQSPQAPHITVDGKSYLSFCSNDYLGLANHPQQIGRAHV